jgi:hypothetical protein
VNGFGSSGKWNKKGFSILNTKEFNFFHFSHIQSISKNPKNEEWYFLLFRETLVFWNVSKKN